MTDPRKRRWFRFSLRTMFVLVTIFGVWLGWNLTIVRERKAIVAEIDRVRPEGFRYYTLEEMEASYAPGALRYAQVSNVRRLLGDRACITLEVPMALEPQWIERTENAFPESILVIYAKPNGPICAFRDSLYTPGPKRQENEGTIFKTGLIKK